MEAAKELMAHSEACLHMQDAQGNTPLHVAAQHPECPEVWRTSGRGGTGKFNFGDDRASRYL